MKGPKLMIGIALALLVGGLPLAAAQRTQGSPSGVVFRVFSVSDELTADGISTTTLVAFLSDGAGNTFNNEQVRFILQGGVGTLFTPELGSDASAEAAQDEASLDRSRQVARNSVNGVSLGNGMYVARFRAGTVPGTATITVVWLNFPGTNVPTETLEIELAEEEQLDVFVDDAVLLADGKDSATIIAYVLDELERPALDAEVTFSVVNGPGTITPVSSAGGRYVARYTAGRAPGNATIEVTLPTISRSLKKRVSIKTVEAARLTGKAFPQEVRVLEEDGRVTPGNTATIVVAVRDGDGKLVRGLSEGELFAQVVNGPGRVSQGREIPLASGEGSGVYYFTFTATRESGSATVRITNVSTLRNPRTDVRIRTVSSTRRRSSQRQQLEVTAYADDPLFSDGQSKGLVVVAYTNAALEEAPDFELNLAFTEGDATLDQPPQELENLSGAEGTGVYVASFTAGESVSRSRARVLATILLPDGETESESDEITTAPPEPPTVVVFPDRLPAGQAQAFVDIFNFEGLELEREGNRYLTEVVSGPGRILQEARNDGEFPDALAGDNVHSALYEAGGTSVEREIILRVTDLAPRSRPFEQVELELDPSAEIEAIAFPMTANRVEMVQVVAFVRDAFGLPAVGHDLFFTVTSGDGDVVADGRMFDDGGTVAGFRDAYANDGVYVGAFRPSGTARGSITLRITDTTPTPQPTEDVRVRVR